MVLPNQNTHIDLYKMCTCIAILEVSLWKTLNKAFQLTNVARMK